MKSYYQVLKEHYPGVMWEGHVLHNDGEKDYIRLSGWPTDVCPCPTMEEIEALRVE